jgi:hypothetical protein
LRFRISVCHCSRKLQFGPYTIDMEARLRLLCHAAVVAVLCSPCSRAQNLQTQSRLLTSDQAATLVIAALSKQEKRLPGIQAEPSKDPHSPQFLFFTVMWAPAANWSGSVVVENYAVDTRTGDVWSATISCMEESNRQLRALQRHLRNNLGLSDAEYRHLKTTGPLCEK